MIKKNPLITVKNLQKSFKGPEAKSLVVLNKMKFTLYEDEIVAILGKSGSGKSTLLRIIAGLMQPSSGEILYQGIPIDGPIKGIAMVFQNFALLLWLTVLENVELGLEAQGVDRKERRQRALATIDMIGLDGFESAYPKELSGGMQQRVGMARALVINPEVLLMDEPFSSLDILTSENLRRDLINLWESEHVQTKSILFVTHNIEEAAMLADRIVIFTPDAGHIRADLQVSMPRPRSSQDPRFKKLIDDIYTLMTTGVRAMPVFSLPDANANELIGLLDALTEMTQTGSTDLPKLAEKLGYAADDLFPLTEGLELLHFAKVSQGDIELLPDGVSFFQADILERKMIFAEHLRKYVPLAQHIGRLLQEHPDHQLSEEDLLDELKETLSEEEAERVLTVIIDWGRYAEIFAYNYDTGILSLENPE